MTLMIKTCQEYDSFMCLNMNVFKVWDGWFIGLWPLFH
jgi:hypothetical protein